MAQLGVAFVRRLNMFGRNRITIEEMRTRLMDIEDENLRIDTMPKSSYTANRSDSDATTNS